MVKKKTYNWDKLRKEFKDSDLNYCAFSAQKGIPKSTAYAHLKDLIALKNPNTNDNTDEHFSDETFEFLPVEVLEAEAKDRAEAVTFIKTPASVIPNHSKTISPIEIKIKGCSITLHSGFDKTTLKAALEVLTELC